MRVVVDGCHDPVKVSLLIRPSAQAWASYVVPKHKTSRVALTINGKVTDLRARTGSLYESDNGLVSSAVPLGQYPTAIQAPQYPQSFSSRAISAQNNGVGYEVVRGKVRNWAETHVGLYFTFEAAWLTQRTGGSLLDYHASSCYLSLPTVTGPGVEAANVRAMHAINEPTELPGVTPPTIADASILVTSQHALFDLVDSSPDPTDAGPPGDLWTCQVPGMPSLAAQEAGIKVTTPGLVQYSASGVPFWQATGGPEGTLQSEPIAGYDAGAPSDCAAAVALTSGASSTASAFSLVIAGALLSLGLTVLFEELVRRLRREPGSG